MYARWCQFRGLLFHFYFFKWNFSLQKLWKSLKGLIRNSPLQKWGCENLSLNHLSSPVSESLFSYRSALLRGPASPCCINSHRRGQLQGFDSFASGAQETCRRSSPPGAQGRPAWAQDPSGWVPRVRPSSPQLPRNPARLAPAQLPRCGAQSCLACTPRWEHRLSGHWWQGRSDLGEGDEFLGQFPLQSLWFLIHPHGLTWLAPYLAHFRNSRYRRKFSVWEWSVPEEQVQLEDNILGRQTFLPPSIRYAQCNSREGYECNAQRTGRRHVLRP